jgi:hypothetical protein
MIKCFHSLVARFASGNQGERTPRRGESKKSTFAMPLTGKWIQNFMIRRQILKSV